MNTDVASAQNTVFIEKIPCSKACPTQGLSRRSLKIQGIDCTATRRTDAHCNKTPPLMHRLAREPQSSLYRHALVMRNPHGSYASHGAAQAGQPTKISHHLYKCEKFHIQCKGIWSSALHQNHAIQHKPLPDKDLRRFVSWLCCIKRHSFQNPTLAQQSCASCRARFFLDMDFLSKEICFCNRAS